MEPEEAEAFEQLTNFQAILKMRKWDESAKDTTIEVGVSPELSENDDGCEGYQQWEVRGDD